MDYEDLKTPDEFVNIQIAIDLDKGLNIKEISKKYQVTQKIVKKIAYKSDFLKITKKGTSKPKFDENFKLDLLKKIENGESITDVALSGGVTVQTLRRWCKKKGLRVKKSYEELSKKERKEIREMLAKFKLEEVTKLYSLSNDAIKKLKVPLYKNLDPSILSYLFELITKEQIFSVKKLIKILREDNIIITEDDINSFIKRLKSIDII